ncbi:uncharacterized protein [Tenebrio molitor]|uniref:uncharacterized protein isoform X1 n=1 Tax=Tenebrio molitor TaxID=7067 RepID=UPI003624AAFD
MSFFFNTSVTNSMPVLKSDHMNQNQGRTFGPLLGLFLVNLFAKAVTAKYDSYFPFHLSHDPSPWVAYNKPLSNYNYHSYYPHWYPVKNPYNYEQPSYQTYPTLTTAAPFVSSEHLPPDYDSDYAEDYNYGTNTQHPNEFERLIPAESNNVQKQSTQEYTKGTTAHYLDGVTTLNPTTTEDPIPAESNVKVKRQPTQRYRRRGTTRRNKYSQKRRRTTTAPPDDYYDSYEDYTERYKPNRRRPTQNRQSAESYYDDEEYYDSYEATTRYYKKPKRRPTRKANKNQNRNDESFEVEISTERINPNTEIVIVRQSQTTTTQATTTTEPTTVITNSTAAPSTTTANSTTNNSTYVTVLGYGPSNGNEYVSFTYGPPVGKYQYAVPYVDWYSPEATRNAIVKRVRDIVNLGVK